MCALVADWYACVTSKVFMLRHVAGDFSVVVVSVSVSVFVVVAQFKANNRATEIVN